MGSAPVAPAPVIERRDAPGTETRQGCPRGKIVHIDMRLSSGLGAAIKRLPEGRINTPRNA
jgi:hypothetical protein